MPHQFVVALAGHINPVPVDAAAPGRVDQPLGGRRGSAHLPGSQIQETQGVVAVVEDSETAIGQEDHAARLAEFGDGGYAVNDSLGIRCPACRTADGLDRIGMGLGDVEENRTFYGFISNRNDDRVGA